MFTTTSEPRHAAVLLRRAIPAIEISAMDMDGPPHVRMQREYETLLKAYHWAGIGLFWEREASGDGTKSQAFRDAAFERSQQSWRLMKELDARIRALEQLLPWESVVGRAPLPEEE